MSELRLRYMERLATFSNHYADLPAKILQLDPLQTCFLSSSAESLIDAAVSGSSLWIPDANLSHWPEAKVEALRRLLKDQTLVPPEEAFLIEESLPHGHAEAVVGTIRQR